MRLTRIAVVAGAVAAAAALIIVRRRRLAQPAQERGTALDGGQPHRVRALRGGELGRAGLTVEAIDAAEQYEPSRHERLSVWCSRGVNGAASAGNKVAPAPATDLSLLRNRLSSSDPSSRDVAASF